MQQKSVPVPCYYFDRGQRYENYGNFKVYIHSLFLTASACSISVFIRDFARQPIGHTNNTLTGITGQAIDTLRRHTYII